MDTAHGKFSYYMKGWRHGASLQPQDPRAAGSKEYGAQYVQGYEDGSKARSAASRKAAANFGYRPSVLKDII